MVDLMPEKLRVLIRPIDGACTVSVWWGIECGSGDDPQGKSGLAHLTEHLLGLEMNRLAPLSIPACGGVASAHTGLDITSFAWTIPACYWEPTSLTKILTLPVAESGPALAIEKSVVLAERERQRADRSWNLSTAAFRGAFGESGYGRPVIGLADEITSLTVEDIAAQRSRLTKAAQTIVLAGAVDPAQVAEVLGTAEAVNAGAQTALEDAIERLELNRPKGQLSLEAHRFHALAPVPAAMHADALPLLLASMMMGAGPWWRPAMNRAWNPTPGFAGGLSSLQIEYGLHRRTGIWHVSGTAQRPSEELEVLLQDQLNTCFFGSASDKYLETAKRRACRALAYTIERPASQAEWLGRMAIFLGICEEQELLCRMQAINLSDIQRVAHEHLQIAESLSAAPHPCAEEAAHAV
jgi:predicted Zn-dependent peptidase